MHKLFILGCLFLLLVSTRCEDDEAPTTGTLELQFTADFSGEPLQMYADEYDYEDNMAVKFQLFQFYISEVELLSDADPVRVLDVDLVSFKDVQSLDAAAEGIRLNAVSAPIGNYTGIRFKLGVSPDLNATDPGDYSVEHPLSNHYWSASMGYVFTKIEGNADLDGSGSFSEKITFHVGTDAMLREVTFDQEINISGDDNLALELGVDLQKILVAASGEFLNFRETTSDHTTNLDVTSFLADNMPRALSLK